MKKSICLGLVILLLMSVMLISETNFAVFAMSETDEPASTEETLVKNEPVSQEPDPTKSEQPAKKTEKKSDKKTEHDVEAEPESKPDKQAPEDKKEAEPESKPDKQAPEDAKEATPESKPEKPTAEDKKEATPESKPEKPTAEDAKEATPESRPEKPTAEDKKEATGNVYDPQPTKMKEVRKWIDLYIATLAKEGQPAALAIKPHWQYEVAAKLIPEGYHCELIDDDRDFGMKYYSFMEDELVDHKPSSPTPELPTGEDEEEDGQIVEGEEEPEPPADEGEKEDGQIVEGEEEPEPPADEGEEEDGQIVEGEEEPEPPADEGEEEDGQIVEGEEEPLYAPQPTTMEEVQEWIDLFNTTLAEENLSAALAAKPHWQYEVTAELMPEGYECKLIEDDEEFGSAFYTFTESELDQHAIEGPAYDPQPTTMEEVQEWIDLFNTTLAEDGFLAAIAVKPHWQYEVAAELMPEGYCCEMIADDEEFGAEYYSFFLGTPVPLVLSYGTGDFLNKPPSGPSVLKTFELIGNARVDSAEYDNVAIITFDDTSQHGAMWAKTKIDLHYSFATEMMLHLGHAANYSGDFTQQRTVADGMTFTLHNSPDGITAIGSWGSGLGVYDGDSTTRFLENALVIEFDTYYNGSGPVIDPGNGAHCALVLPKTNINASDHQNTFSFTPSKEWIPFAMTWTPNLTTEKLSGTLNYSFNGTSQSYVIDDAESVFDGAEIYWGFTGSTGAYSALHAAAITKLPVQPEVSESINFSFVKVDAQDDSICLEDAQFTLYSCQSGDSEHVHDELAAADSCWIDGRTYQAASNDNGIVTFKNLMSGEYRLVETVAPRDYQLPVGQWQIVVNTLAEEIVITGKGDIKPPDFTETGTGGNKQYQLGNMKQYTLPMTGGWGTRPFRMLGSLLLMVGTAWLYYQLRRRPHKL